MGAQDNKTKKRCSKQEKKNRANTKKTMHVPKTKLRHLQKKTLAKKVNDLLRLLLEELKSCETITHHETDERVEYLVQKVLGLQKEDDKRYNEKLLREIVKDFVDKNQ